MKRLLGIAALLLGGAGPAAADLTAWSWQAGASPTLTLEWNALGRTVPDTVTATLAVPPGCTQVSAQVVPMAEWKTPLPVTATVSGVPRFSHPLTFRDVTLATLHWLPVAPGAGGLHLLTQAKLIVHFQVSAPPPKAFAGAAGEPAERLLAAWVVNYDQSRDFRFNAAGALPLVAASDSGLPPIRLAVFTQTDDIAVLTFDSLRRAGVPVAQIDPHQFRLFRLGREVPLYVENEASGHFQSGDYLEFIGTHAPGQNTYLSPYTTEAEFTLVWNTGRPGLRAPAVPVVPRATNPVPAPPFQTTAHVEQDNVILRIGSTAAADITDLGSQVSEEALSDFWYWQRMGVNNDAVNVSFDLPFTPAFNPNGAAPTATATASIELKGITDDINANPDHHLRFLLNGTDISLVNGVRSDAIWDGQAAYQWTSPPLPLSAFKPGANVLTLVRVNDLLENNGQPVQNQDAYLNYLDFTLTAAYAAVHDQLHFSNTFADSLGLQHFRLTGFSSPDLSLWDTRGRKLVGFATRAGAGGTQVDFEDSLVTAVSYIAVTAAARETPRLELDTVPDLLYPSAGADEIIVTHRSLYGQALDSLVAQRTKQGLRVKVVDIYHVNQTFGDGSTNPEAVKNFAQWAYDHWPRPAPTYLLLLGGTSDWFDKLAGIYQRNLVPTHLVDIRGWGIAADDDYFGQVAGDDAISDMLVGRLPVSTPAELSQVVHKMLRLEQRPPGAWQNKTFFVGGYEQTFTDGQNLLQSVAAGENRPPERLDLFTGSPYYAAPGRRPDFYRQLDSAFDFVGFFGHGGGSVWSDDGILTLDALDQDSLRGDYPVPLVSSITCLTGYFEDVAERSLGEEMIKRPANGAAGFYGAAGYISSAAGQVLAAEMFRAATQPGTLSLGGIVQEAETRVMLETGSSFLPILAEFNLLGDPAMPYAYAPLSGSLNASPQVLGATRSLQVTGDALAVTSGQGLASLLIGDSLATVQPVTVSGGKVQTAFTLPDTLPIFEQGKAILHVWDDSHAAVYTAAYSGLDWMIDSLRLQPANPQPGDSVRVLFTLRADRSYQTAAGVLLYSVSGQDDAGDFPADNQVVLVNTAGNDYATSRPFAVPFPPPSDTLLLQINLAVRLNLADSNGAALPPVSSRTYSFPLVPLARLTLMAPAFDLPVQDSLGVWVRYRNDGLGSNGQAHMRLTADPNGAAPWSDSADLAKGLKLGQIDSVFLPFPDSAAHLPLRAVIVADNPAEASPTAAVQDTAFGLWTALLSRTTDSLAPWPQGPVLRLAAAGARRIFAGENGPVNFSPPLSAVDTSAFAHTAFYLATRAPSAGALVLQPPAVLAADSASGAPAAWHYAVQPSGPWLRVDTATNTGPTVLYADGYYGYFRNSDHIAPVISFHSRGQNLLPDDYIPRNTPVEILLEDPSGIDLTLRKPRLVSEGLPVDSASVVIETSGGFPTLARLQFQPPQTEQDSVLVLAYDAAGNEARQSFSFRVGEALAIRNLGGYPNPFADTTIFAYELTDYCDQVTLRVYSRAGRTVRTLYDYRAVGYREVVWDGRADDGQPIANGLYFLKATARSGDREATATFKLFKKKY